MKKVLGIALSLAAAASVASANDFNGDGNADILWKKSDGGYHIWLMNGASKVGTLVLGQKTGWSVQGLGDFNGDTNSDILWKKMDGSYVVWTMDGTGITGTINLGSKAGWSVEEVADFNGDANADILWKNTKGNYVVSFTGGSTVFVSNHKEWTVEPSCAPTSTNEVSFEEIPTPTGADQNSLQSSPSAVVNGQTESLSFTKLMATGDLNNGEMFGLVKDVNDTAITFGDGSPYVCNGTNSGVGSGLDYTSILQKNGKLYMVAQFECQIGAIYKAELNQDANGSLTVKPNSLEFVSQKAGFGGFVHCAGQTTPWNSHLGSEEYETNARFVESDMNATTGLTGSTYYDETAKFWGGNALLMSPYYYGWTPEVSIDAAGNAVYVKHYVLGRFSHEITYVMPDEKTAYLSDDGTDVGLFMFKADTTADLSAGTLYAAKWMQTSAANGGAANISWIPLGHATDAEIEAIVNPDGDIMTNDAPVFSDIFNIDTANEGTGSCAAGFASIHTSAGHECLQVKTGMEKAAAFLETRRYAAILGATTEFRKEEGITFDAVNNKLYVAMSEVRKGMLDGSSNDLGGPNDIRLAENKCGAVYALDVNSDMVATNMYAIVTGETIAADSDGNTCHLDKISNPDNVTFLPNSNILTIGEDTGSHKNNIIWAFDINTNKLTRILATPIGAETTSPFWHPNVNGYGYMTAVTQHPDTSSADAGESNVGVLGTFKNLK